MAANPVAPVPELTFTTETTPTETIVRCSGRITSSTADLLRNAVRDLIPTNKSIQVDLTDVGYLDSAGLGMFVGLYITAKRGNCRLKLINLNQRIRELLSLTRLAEVLEGHEEYLGLTPD